MKDRDEGKVDGKPTINSIIDYCVNGIVILSANGKLRYVSRSVENILGYTQEEAMQQDVFSLLHPDDSIPVSKVMQEVLGNPGVAIKGHTGRMRHKDGTWRWVEATLTNMLHDPEINGIIDVFNDVTDTYLAYEQLEHANRMYAFISQVNQMIVKVKTETELFAYACEIALGYGKFSAAMVAIANPAKEDTLHIIASAGMPESGTELFRDYTYNYNGLQGRVLHSGQSFICNNIAEDNDIKNWHEYAALGGG